jgi:hypothetical protein
MLDALTGDPSARAVAFQTFGNASAARTRIKRSTLEERR